MLFLLQFDRCWGKHRLYPECFLPLVVYVFEEIDIGSGRVLSRRDEYLVLLQYPSREHSIRSSKGLVQVGLRIDAPFESPLPNRKVSAMFHLTR